MTNGPEDKPVPSSEPATLILSNERQSAEKAEGQSEASFGDAAAHTQGDSDDAPKASFSSDEGPTLSSPSVNSESKFTTLTGLDSRVSSLESRLAQNERELQDVYGAVEHLVDANERLERALRQQRLGRYLVWGTLIAILAILWLSMQSRLGSLLPR